MRRTRDRPLHPLGPSIWTVDHPQRYHGLEVGSRMTVIRLQTSSLMLISPIPIDEALAAALAALGPVGHLIAPNDYHHGSLQAAASRYRQATVHVSAGLITRHADLSPSLLAEVPAAEWADEVRQTRFDGLAVREFSHKVPLNEVVFCHQPSRTLILTDAAHHVTAEASWGFRCIAGLSGSYGKLAPSVFERLAITERARLRAALERVLSWDFDQVIMAHGRLIRQGGKQKLAAGYRWLQPAPPPDPECDR